MKKLKICLIEDEEILLETLKDDLLDAGYSVAAFEHPLKALEYITKNNVDVVVSDIRLPQITGFELLPKIKAAKPETFVIMMTAFGTVKSAVEAMKNGAYDYLIKPFDKDELRIILDRIKELLSLQKRNRNYQTHFYSKYSLENFVGESNFVKELRNTIQLVANSNSTVLITGETGTGKELVASLIHYSSPRKEQTLIKVSCAILSREVIESELFGHEKGAYTGADKQRIGRFEASDGGTIYLDDIDDVPLEVQVKLLRVLQEQEIERVGSNEPIKIDVRVITSTKRNLLELVKQGKFREDLYYRLNIIPIHIKPLRERREDILPLFRFFIQQFSENRRIAIDETIFDLITSHLWPGNVRELKNLVERLIIMCDDSITANKLPNEMFVEVNSDLDNISQEGKSLNDILEEIEIKLIKATLLKTSGNKAKAAELLGIPASTLKNKIEKYKID